MKLTLTDAGKMMGNNGGSLYLKGTQITALPDNLTVGGALDLDGTQITALPDNLTVGGSLYLKGTQITALPDNLTVGGYLDLRGTQITALPDNLTVGGYLDLRGTQITALPDNLTVGGSLYLKGTQITATKYKTLTDGDYVEGRYIYCDGMLTHLKSSKQVKGYTYYIGKIKNRNVISDGTHFVHCKNFKIGIADLEFKKASSRGTEQYKNLTLESILPLADAMAMYRVITGACQQGTENFVNSLRNVKGQYSVKEMIELTKNAYRGKTFERFFKND